MKKQIEEILENNLMMGVDVDTSEAITKLLALFHSQNKKLLEKVKEQDKVIRKYREGRYKYTKQYRKRQTEAGNCRTCGKKAITKGACPKHREMDLKNGKDYRQRKKLVLDLIQKEGEE